MRLGSQKTGYLSAPGATGETQSEMRFTLQISPTSRVEFRAKRTSGDLWMRVALHDDQGAMIAADDVFGGDYNPRMRILLVEGAYTIVVTRDSGSGDFQLNVDTAQPLEEVAVGHPVNGQLVGTSADSLYYIELFDLVISQPDTLDIHLDASPSGLWDPILAIYDDRWRLLVLDDDGGYGRDSWIRRMPLGIGTYTLVALRFLNGGDFELSVEQPSEPAVVTIGEPIVGPVQGDDPYLEFGLTLNSAQALDFTLLDTSGNADLQLFILTDRFGFIAADDNSGDGLNAFISMILEAGSYIVIVEAVSGAGHFSLGISSAAISLPRIALGDLPPKSWMEAKPIFPVESVGRNW